MFISLLLDISVPLWPLVVLLVDWSGCSGGKSRRDSAGKYDRRQLIVLAVMKTAPTKYDHKDAYNERKRHLYETF